MAVRIIEKVTQHEYRVAAANYIERELVRSAGQVVGVGDWLLYDNDTAEQRLVGVVSSDSAHVLWVEPDEQQTPPFTLPKTYSGGSVSTPTPGAPGTMIYNIGHEAHGGSFDWAAQPDADGVEP